MDYIKIHGILHLKLLIIIVNIQNKSVQLFNNHNTNNNHQSQQYETSKMRILKTLKCETFYLSNNTNRNALRRRLTYEDFLRMVYPSLGDNTKIREWIRRQSKSRQRACASHFDVDIRIPSADYFKYLKSTSQFIIIITYTSSKIFERVLNTQSSLLSTRDADSSSAKMKDVPISVRPFDVNKMVKLYEKAQKASNKCSMIEVVIEKTR